MLTHNAFLAQLDEVISAGRRKRRDLSQLARSITSRQIQKIKADPTLSDDVIASRVAQTYQEAVARVGHFMPQWIGIDDTNAPEGTELPLS